MKMTISEAIQIVKDNCYNQEPKNFAEERGKRRAGTSDWRRPGFIDRERKG